MQVSVVYKSELEQIKFRIDAEYYSSDYLSLDKFISRISSRSIKGLGGILDCSAFYPSITSYYNFESIGIPFLRVNDIQNGFVNISENTVFLPEAILDENKTTISEVYPEELVIAKGGNSLAKVGVVPSLFPKYAICRDLIVLRTNMLYSVNKFYLWIFLHSKLGQDLLLRTASQTGQPHLTLESIYELKVPILKTFFQNIYEKMYFQILELNENAKNLYTQVEHLLLSELGLADWQPKHQLSFVKNFSDTQGTERIDAEYFQPKYDEIVDAVKNYKGGWDRLGNLVKMKKCVEPGSDVYQESGVPFVRVSNLSKFEITDNNQQYISEKLYQELIEHQPEQNEILLSKDATPGIAYHLKDKPGRMICSGGILRLIVKNRRRISTEYLTLMLNSTIVQQQILRDAGGSIINHWRLDQIRNTVVPILSEESQREIQSKIEFAFNQAKLSKQLLEIAKRGVEMAIEQDEETAEEWIKMQVNLCVGKEVE